MNIVTRIGTSFGLAAAGFCLSLSPVPAADDRGAIASTVDQAFRPLLGQYDVPGMAVAVTIGGHRYFFDYGLASKEGNVPVTEDTLFEIGSLSKTYTATLASYAQALGKISLNDTPGKYIPELRGSPIDKASLLNLGTFTAGGLPLQFPDAVARDSDVTAYFQQWKPSAEPGAQRRYSNPSIGLFGYAASRALDGDFSDLVQSVLFPKLGLRHSYIRVPQSEMNRYAWGYDKADKPIRVHPGAFDAEAYGVKTTAPDLIRFIELNIRPGELEPTMRRAVEGTHIGYFKVGEMVQGLGWEQYPFPIALDQVLAGNSSRTIMEANPATALVPPQTLALFNKTGSTNGFAAYAAFVPAKSIGIVMLANKNFPIPARITAAYAVLERLSEMAE